MRVVLAQSGGKQPVEFVEHLLLVHAAVNEYLNDFTFLLLLQAEAGDIFKSLHIVLCADYGLEYGFLYISIHVLLLGDIQDFILSLFLVPLEQSFRDLLSGSLRLLGLQDLGSVVPCPPQGTDDICRWFEGVLKNHLG